MSSPLSFMGPFSESLIDRLGWVLMHSLWQFALVALLASIGLRMLRRQSATKRYGALIIALAVLMAAPVATWLLQPGNSTAQGSGLSDAAESKAAMLPRGSEPETSVPTADRSASSGAPDTQPAPSSMKLATPSISAGAITVLRPWLAWIVAFWSIGVVLCSLRPLLGWRMLRRLRREGVSPASDEMLALLQRVSDRLGMHRAVCVVQSTLVQVPVMVGCVRPLILLPVSVVANMPVAQLEAILAHELAHVRRHDFLINLLQILVETIFFYHPAVWWLSRRIRVEREHCCDDLVVLLLGNRVEYGRALVAVEQMRGQGTVLALGASDGSLLSRVRRIVGGGSEHDAVWPFSRWPAAVLSLASLMLVFSLSMDWSVAANDDAAALPASAKVDDLPLEPALSSGAKGNTDTISDKAPGADAKPVLTISGQVLDADTGRPIEKCRVVPAGFDFVENRDRTTWQSQYLKEFTDGRFRFETDRPWAMTRLRIEADGYRPTLTRTVFKGEKNVAIDVKLVREVFAGVVLLPNGKPAAKAQLAVASYTNEVVVRSGKLSYGGHGNRLRKVVESDAQGRFELPAEIDPSVLVVAHDSGYAEVMTIESTTARIARELDQPAKAKLPDNQAHKITLQPWGRVEGRILTRNKPIAGAKFWIYPSRTDDVFVHANESVESDADGRFAVARIPASANGICQRCVDSSDGQGSHFISGLIVHFDIPAGKTTTLLLDGKGRTLIGMLAIPDGVPVNVDWSKAILRVFPKAPRFNAFERDNGPWQTWSQFLQSEEGKQYSRDKVAIAADGSFRIEGLPPAEYQLVVSAPVQAVPGDPKAVGDILRGGLHFAMPLSAAPAGQPPMDLGIIKLAPAMPSKKGASDQNGSNTTPLVKAIDDFNSKAKSDPIRREQATLTKKEVIETIRAAGKADFPKKVTEALYQSFKRIADTDELPLNVTIDAHHDLVDCGDCVVDAWEVRLTLPKEGGGSSYFTIRTRHLGQTRTLAAEADRLEKLLKNTPDLPGRIRLEERVKELRQRAAGDT